MNNAIQLSGASILNALKAAGIEYVISVPDLTTSEGVLRPLAEAYLAQDDVATARTLYAQAVEAGVANPNSRPRAEDLSATCCSMALHGFEPDEALWARLVAVRASLAEPW